MGRSAWVAFCFLAIFVSGCASTQLTYNSVDIASSVTDLYSREILNNLSKFIDDPHALPSQVDITAGTIQTSNSVTPSFTYPLSKSFTANGGGLVTSTVLAGSGLSINASDSWQQNWNVLPISDANTLRNLQAIYRYATLGSDLIAEYHVPRKAKDGAFPEDPYWLLPPHCVVCVNRKSGARFVNPKLRSAWLFWDGNYPPGESVISLGRFGQHELSMRATDFQKGVFSDFVLFVLPNGAPSDGGAKAGGDAKGPRGAAAPNRPNFTPPIPQILPAPP